jgi:DNA-binding response OmpR family regulator
VLVADDDRRMRALVRWALEGEGYEVYEAADGAEAERLATERLPHLVVLDVVMPYLPGLDLLRRWRSRRVDVSVIVLTAFGDDDSVAEALEAGADDYLTKPFRTRELVARVNAVLRRTQGWGLGDALMSVGDVRLDLAGRRVIVGERVIPLSKTELALLRELMGSPGRVFAAEELLAKVWGPEYRGDAEILRTNIYRLRRKLNREHFLGSRPGAGYFVSPSTTEHATE